MRLFAGGVSVGFEGHGAFLERWEWEMGFRQKEVRELSKSVNTAQSVDPSLGAALLRKGR